MKKAFVTLMAAAVTLSLAGCGNESGTTDAGAATTEAAPKVTQKTETTEKKEVTETKAAENEETKGAVKATEADEKTTSSAGVEEGSNKSASGEAEEDIYVDIYGVYAEDDLRGQFMQEIADEYAKQYESENGVTVKIQYIYQNGYDGVAEKLTTGAVSKELPVIGQIEESFLPQFYPIATDLSSYFDQEVIDNYLDGLMVSTRYEDTLYAVPGGRSYPVVYLNRDLVEKAGHKVDEIKDWNDFHEVAADIAALGDDISGYGIYWDTDCWMWESALYSNGGSVTNDEGTEVTFQKDGAGAVFPQLVQEMLADGSAYSAYGESASDAMEVYQEKFLKGKMGMLFTSCTSYGSLKNLIETEGYDPVDIVVIDQPAGTAGNSVTTGGSNFIICNTATEDQKKVAAGFLTYFSSDENQAEWNRKSGYLATTKSVYDSEYYKENAEDPNLVQIAEGVQYAHKRPQTKYWREMYTYMVQKLEDFAMHPDQYDCTQLMDEMAEYCQEIIENGGQ